MKRSEFLGMFARVLMPIGILLAGIVVFAILSVELEEAKSPPAKKQALRTKVTPLRIEDYPVIIRAHGIVQPHNDVSLSAQVSGQIISISPSFETGAHFSEGDVLVELDPRQYKLDIAVAEAELQKSKLALQLATQAHNRSVEFQAENLISEVEAEQTLSAQLQAEAELNSAAARLERAELDLERTRIKAPFDGRVRQKIVGLGQTVGAGTVLGQVFAVDFAEIRLPIAGREARYLDLPELASDEPVDVELRDAVLEESETVWNGRIIRTEGMLNADSLELFAIAQVDDPFGLKSGDPPLRIGLPVEGAIRGRTLTNVVALPRASVQQLDKISLVNPASLTLVKLTIDPIWSNEEHIVVRDPRIQNGALLATTHLVYAPDGADVEIIEDMESGGSP